MAPTQDEHLPCCTEKKIGVLTVPGPLQLSSLIALPLLPLDSCFPADFDIVLESHLPEDPEKNSSTHH